MKTISMPRLLVALFFSMTMSAAYAAEQNKKSVVVGDIGGFTPVLNLLSNQYSTTSVLAGPSAMSANTASRSVGGETTTLRQLVLVNIENQSVDSLKSNRALLQAQELGLPVVFSNGTNDEIAKVIASHYGVGIPGDNVLVLPPQEGFGGKLVSYYQKPEAGAQSRFIKRNQAAFVDPSLPKELQDMLYKQHSSSDIANMIGSWLNEYFTHKDALLVNANATNAQE